MAGAVLHEAALAVPTRVRCATYNLLAEYFCDAAYFRHCNPSHLKYGIRLRSAMQILQDEMHAGSILCLQEVSYCWKRDLASFFAARSRNYAFHTPREGSLNVGIAYPADKYKVVDETVVVVKSLYPFPRKDSTVVATMKQGLGQAGFSLLNGEALDVKNLTLNRPNAMTCLRLQCKSSGAEFVVGTFHMPCCYKTPSIMVAHAALSAKYIHDWSKGAPYIYCGDFNSTPATSPYRLLTQGSLPDDHPNFPHLGDGWLPSISPLRSAYEVKDGREPEFTNFARVKNDPAFVDTIDYIFISKEWKVDAVKKLPTIQETKGPLPNDREPSDHILIASNLSLS